MSNTLAPFGLQPVHTDGRPWEGALSVYHVPASDATALYIGDPVTLTSLGNDGTPGVTRATSADAIVGVFMGVKSPLNAHGVIYRQASVATDVLVADDPYQSFMVQSDGTIAEYAVGLNIFLSAGTGSTVTGRSGFVVDGSTVSSLATVPFQLVRFAPIAGDAAESGTTYPRVIVKPNLHKRAPGSTPF